MIFRASYFCLFCRRLNSFGMHFFGEKKKTKQKSVHTQQFFVVVLMLFLYACSFFICQPRNKKSLSLKWFWSDRIDSRRWSEVKWLSKRNFLNFFCEFSLKHFDRNELRGLISTRKQFTTSRCKANHRRISVNNSVAQRWTRFSFGHWLRQWRRDDRFTLAYTTVELLSTHWCRHFRENDSSLSTNVSNAKNRIRSYGHCRWHQ